MCEVRNNKQIEVHKFFLFLSMMLFTVSLQTNGGNTITLRFIETSDVHGAFFPYNFIERQPMSGTMARLSSYIKKQRAVFGQNLILIDNGDILQGQPTSYYSNFICTNQPNIAAEVINYLNFNAESFGNHDIETGHIVFDKWINDLHCPMLGANVVDLKSGKPYVEPYIILERDGVRIAIFAMLTPAIPNWLAEHIWSGMAFEEIVSSTRRWVKLLREKEGADIVIGMFHSGWEGGISTGDYDEDATRKVVEQVEGLDVVFFGHDHTEHHSTVKGVLCLNPSCNVQKVAQATIQVRNGKVISKKGELVDITKEPIDEDYINHFQPQIDSIRSYVERPIGTFLFSMHSRDSFFGPAPFTDYIHQLQLEHTGADVSFTAPLAFDTDIDAGTVCMGDLFKLYKFENKIYVLRMKGSEIRHHLEYSYDKWVNTMTSPDDHLMQLEPKAAGDNQKSGFRNFYFNFDSAAGIDYVVDVTKPDGQKVYILQFSDGRPFYDNEWYRVVMNSYRGNGGGELLTQGAGIPKDSLSSRTEYRSEYDQRYYLMEKILRVKEVHVCSLDNWRFIPDAWVRTAKERDMQELFGSK